MLEAPVEAVPVPSRGVGGPELQACVRDVGARLVSAADPPADGDVADGDATRP